MKYHPSGSVLFITFSLEQGILLLNNRLGHLIVKSSFARAQNLYPVRICHLIVESNHVHILAVASDPECVPAFIRSFKTESAHYLNRLLGRRKRTIWCEGYDSPIILTFARALIAIGYLYVNPAKDNLVESIDSYPGFSTWMMFRKKIHSIECPRLSRASFELIPSKQNNLSGHNAIAEKVEARSDSFESLTIEPNAWMECFGFSNAEEQGSINQKLVDHVRRLEARACGLRIKNKKRVIGETKLAAQMFDLNYLSRRQGKRMWCLSEKRSIRMKFINYFRDLMSKARQIRVRWFLGDFSIPYPPGLHPPSVPRLANVLTTM